MLKGVGRVSLRKKTSESSKKSGQKNDRGDEEEAKRYSCPPEMDAVEAPLSVNVDNPQRSAEAPAAITNPGSASPPDVEEKGGSGGEAAPAPNGVKRRFSLKKLFGNNKPAKKETTATDDVVASPAVSPPGVSGTVVPGEEDLGVPIPPDDPANSAKPTKSARKSRSLMSRIRSLSVGREGGPLETRSVGGGSAASGLGSEPASTRASFSGSHGGRGATPAPSDVVLRHPPVHSASMQPARSMHHRSSTHNGFIYRRPFIPGVTGMANLDGVSCFMNAVVQCLSHVDPLAQYLSTNDFAVDLVKNAEKWQKDQRHDLTDTVANLIRSLWRHSYRSKITDLFRLVVSHYKPDLVSPGKQQDAQEFLLFLLNTMHEELNQSRRSLYRTKSQKPDAATNSDLIISAQEFSKKNQSLIYKLFAGLQQTSIVCPSCSGTFRSLEPYLSLSLPIPTKQSLPVYITHIDLQFRHTRHGFVVSTHDKISRLRRMFARRLQVDKAQIVLQEMTPQGFGKTFKDEERIEEVIEASCQEGMDQSGIGSAGVFALELPDQSDSEDDDDEAEGKVGRISLAVSHAELVKVDGEDEPGAEDGGRRRRKKREKQYRRFGGPAVLRMPLNASFEDLEEALLRQLRSQFDVKVTGKSVRLHYWIIDGPNGQEELRMSEECPQPFANPAVQDAVAAFSEGGEGAPILKLLVVWSHKHRVAMFPDDFLAEVEDPEYDDSVSRVSYQFPHGVDTRENKPIALEDCFQAYMGKEKLSSEDSWLCPKCHSAGQASISSSLWTTPDLLVLHLKRFRHHKSPMVNGGSGEEAGEKQQKDGVVQKLDLSVSYPLSGLDIRPYLEKANGLSVHRDSLSGIDRQELCSITEDYVYDLVSVVNHTGPTAASGHYTTMASSPLDFKWRLFDDAKIKEVHAEQVHSSSAYLLFYQRRSSIQRCQPPPKTRHWSLTRLDIPPGSVHPVISSTMDPNAAHLSVSLDTATPLLAGTTPNGNTPATGPAGGRDSTKRRSGGEHHTASLHRRPPADGTAVDGLMIRHSFHGSRPHHRSSSANRLSMNAGHMNRISLQREILTNYQTGSGGIGGAQGPSVEAAQAQFVATNGGHHHRDGDKHQSKSTKPARIKPEESGYAVHTRFRSTVHVPVMDGVDHSDIVDAATTTTPPGNTSNGDTVGETGDSGSPTSGAKVAAIPHRGARFVWRGGRRVWVDPADRVPVKK